MSESIYDKDPSGEGSALFLRFSDGVKHTIRLFGNGIEFKDEYKGEVKTKYASLCIFRNKETKTNELKIYSFGWSQLKQIIGFRQDEDWGDPREYDITISATGDGMNRRYALVPKTKKVLTDTEKELISGCDIDLWAMCTAKSPTANPDDDYDPYSDD